MAQGRAIAPRIDADTGAYFTELKQHFDQLEAGSEEQELLVGNALAEAAGQPAGSWFGSSNAVTQVAGRPVCTVNGFGAGWVGGHAAERVLHLTKWCVWRVAWGCDRSDSCLWVAC